jgi:hypothetical protein
MFGTFHSVWTFDLADSESLNLAARKAMSVLQIRPGFISANIFRSADSPERYLVQTDWQDVGSYRRALGSTEAKLEVWPFLANMHDQPTAFEKLFTMDLDSTTDYETSVNDGV